MTGPGQITREEAAELLRRTPASIARWAGFEAEPGENRPCDCCEINDYDPEPEGTGLVPGSCVNCGHSPEEHAS